jgi:DNA-binding NtrC family response regulator
VEHFVEKHGKTRRMRWSNETCKILEEYDFPGNIRELENLITHCLAECPGSEILPFHLPVSIMQQRREDVLTSETAAENNGTAIGWPRDWLDLPQKEAMKRMEQAFNRVYLPRLLEATRHNVTKAATAAGIDQKTFRKKWTEAGLPPLSSEAE